MKNLFLIFIPALLLLGFLFFVRVAQYESLTIAPPEERKEGSPLTIPLSPSDPILGDKKAPITLIAFEDFGCDHCKTQSTIFEELLRTYPGQFKIIWKGLPVTRFPVDTRLSHAYGYCMNEQGKFNEFKQLAFANSTNLTRTTLNTIVSELGVDPLIIETCIQGEGPENHIKQVEFVARTLNIQAVPAIFKDGVQLHAPGSVLEWAQLLELES